MEERKQEMSKGEEQKNERGRNTDLVKKERRCVVQIDRPVVK